MAAAADDDFKGLMNSLRGGISTDEAALLRRLAGEVTGGCIVDVGASCGKSAAALSAGARRHQSGAKPGVYCIGTHRPFGAEDHGASLETMRATDAFRDVSLINLSSAQVVPGWREPVGLLCMGGDAGYHAVKQDFEGWEPHLPPGALVAFGKAANPSSGAYRLVRELLHIGGYRRIDDQDEIIVLKKLAVVRGAAAPVPAGRRRILVACHDIVLTGGLQRFGKTGRVLQAWGHEVAFAVISDSPVRQWDPGLPVLSLEQASQGRWDMVMVPGAGFPPETIERFAVLRDANFGVRVQHILNDQTRRPGFERVNSVFCPHIVVFNNTHWPPGSYSAFQADRFHHLLGAVDTRSFRPCAYRAHPLRDGQWVIGGLANKNPVPLVEALLKLPQEAILRLYGVDEHRLGQTYKDLVDAGRLHLMGPLHGDELCRFYREVDCVVMTEPNAGWANLVAEAMASGVPVVCTPHGTAVFAQHEVTALLVESPEPEALAEAVQRLRRDNELCARLAERARAAVEPYSWEEYARQLLRLLPHDGISHYTYAPDLGLHGKWPIEGRLTGLEGLLAAAGGMSVIDLGCAEGVVAREFLSRGAAKVHGFEIDPDRIAVAKALCAAWPDTVFRAGDLSPWQGFVNRHADVLDERYDVVLYLGIHHHLPENERLTTLVSAAGLARAYIAVRTTPALFEKDRIDEILAREGFEPFSAEDTAGQARHLGPARIYRRLSD